MVIFLEYYVVFVFEWVERRVLGFVFGVFCLVFLVYLVVGVVGVEMGSILGEELKGEEVLGWDYVFIRGD